MTALTEAHGIALATPRMGERGWIWRRPQAATRWWRGEVVGVQL